MRIVVGLKHCGPARLAAVPLLLSIAIVVAACVERPVDLFDMARPACGDTNCSDGQVCLRDTDCNQGVLLPERCVDVPACPGPLDGGVNCTCGVVCGGFKACFPPTRTVPPTSPILFTCTCGP